MSNLSIAVKQLLEQQIPLWPLAGMNYEALKKVQTRSLVVNGWRVVLQFNPERIRSSAAKVDARSVKERKCFLCPANLPDEQLRIPFGADYQVIMNPFPIFRNHLTIPVFAHEEQRILPRFGDMLLLAQELTDFVVFYNGPQCGASAPDHMHFQAGNKGFLPIEMNWKTARKKNSISLGKATLCTLEEFLQPVFLLVSETKDDSVLLFSRLHEALPVKDGGYEPMMNVLSWYEDNKWITCVYPRRKLRPSCYYAEGENNILLSPASVEMAGVFAVPLEKDFNKITSRDITNVLQEVCISVEEMNMLIAFINHTILK